MKKIINKLVVLSLIVMGGMACQEQKMGWEQPGSFTPASELLTPLANANVELMNVAAATTTFSWTAAPTSSGAVSYHVAFYNAGGEEIFRIGNGENSNSETSIDIPHSTLMMIAALGGIKEAETGEISWNVISVIGNKEIIGASSNRVLSITRYASFFDKPVNLYASGESTENGSDISKAMRFRQNGDSVFEIYTELEAGKPFFLTNLQSSGGRKFTLQAIMNGDTVEGYTIIEDETAWTVPGTEGEKTIYNLVVDFGTGIVNVRTITSVSMYYYATGSSTFTSKDLEYKGGGLWEVEHTLRSDLVETANNNSSNQYKFLAVTSDGNRTWAYKNQSTSVNGTNYNGAGVQPTEMIGDYYYVVENTSWAGTGNNRGRYTYRFMTALAGQTVTVRLHMTDAANPYYHEIDAGDLTVYPVEEFLSPAANASVQLTTDPDGKVEFSWTASSGIEGPTPKYQLVFFSDAEGTTELGRVTAGSSGLGTTASVSYADLESYAHAAGIAIEGEGTIYWSVNTIVLSDSAIAGIDPRPLVVKRIPALPEALYITGSATEFGATIANAGKMTPRLTYAIVDNAITETAQSGAFEIYTRLTAGTYMFVSGTSGDYRTFSLSGSRLVETSTPITVTETGIYKIVATLNNQSLTLQKINSVRFKMLCAGVEATLTYAGKGVWNASDVTARFYSNDTGSGGWNDDRAYVWVNLGGADTKFGGRTKDANNNADINEKAAEGDSRYYIYNGPDTSEWDYAWKVWSNYRGALTSDGKKFTNIKFNLSTTENNFGHYYIYLQYPN